MSVPNGVGLCPEHAPEWYMPLSTPKESGKPHRCPECNKQLVVYRNARYTELVATNYASLLEGARQDWRNGDLDLYAVAIELANQGVTPGDSDWGEKVGLIHKV